MDWVNEFLEWVWARHHNELSWYVRPFFILPFCWFAYRRNVWGVLLVVLVLPTSLFWFPAPDQPSPRVEQYLALEREFLMSGGTGPHIALALLVVAFFFALGAAFWRRSWIWGLVVCNAGTLLKVAWSVGFGGAAGWASVPPSVATLAVVNTVVVAAALRRKRRKEPSRAAPRTEMPRSA